MPATVYNGCMGFLPFAVVRRRRRRRRRRGFICE